MSDRVAGNRRYRDPLFRLALPAQPVDATPSNALIRQCFPGRSDLFGCPRSKPIQGSVPADLTLASDLAFVFNASRVRLECCVDPLRPPRLSGLGRRPFYTPCELGSWDGTFDHMEGAAARESQVMPQRNMICDASGVLVLLSLFTFGSFGQTSVATTATPP